MKLSKIFILTLPLALISLNTGCTGRTMLTASALPKHAIKIDQGKPITSEACGFQLFSVIPIMSNDRQERAWDLLVDKSQGKYLTDIQMNETWVYLLIGHSYCTKIKATSFPYENNLSD